MSKLLKEGLFSALVNALSQGKQNKAIDQLRKDPEIKQAIDKYKKSSLELQSSIDSYVARYGENDFSKTINRLRKK